MHDLAGIHFMLPTPFRPDGALDTGPIQRLVDEAARAGCRGVVCLGVMGEAPRLSDGERSRVIDAVVAASNGRLSVTVGVTSPSDHLMGARAKEAAAAGASAVMVAPPPLAKPNDEAVFHYYAAVDDAVGVPVVVQDYPLESGVHMTPEFIARLSRDLGQARYLKLEDPPTPTKITRILEATGDQMGIFGGLGGTFLFEELRRGAIGTMTGFAYPEVLVNIHERIQGGDVEGARGVFYRWLPLIRYETQPGIGLSIRKHVLKRRGLLDCPDVRRPGPPIDAPTTHELEDVLRAMDLIS